MKYTVSYGHFVPEPEEDDFTDKEYPYGIFPKKWKTPVKDGKVTFTYFTRGDTFNYFRDIAQFSVDILDEDLDLAKEIERRQNKQIEVVEFFGELFEIPENLISSPFDPDRDRYSIRFPLSLLKNQYPEFQDLQPYDPVHVRVYARLDESGIYCVKNNDNEYAFDKIRVLKENKRKQRRKVLIDNEFIEVPVVSEYGYWADVNGLSFPVVKVVEQEGDHFILDIWRTAQPTKTLFRYEYDI